MDRGYIKLYRKLQDNPLWKREPFTKGQAWVDLILLANHQDGSFFTRGVEITVQRGQVGWSEIALSERWRWSRTKLRAFLTMLEKEQQIVQQKNNITSLITIVNYETYQKKDSTKNTKSDSRKTTEKQQKNTNKNEKNEKEESMAIPEWLPVKIWQQFIEHRKFIKKPMSVHAQELMIKRLDRSRGNYSPQLLLERAIANNWSDFYEHESCLQQQQLNEYGLKVMW